MARDRRVEPEPRRRTPKELKDAFETYVRATQGNFDHLSGQAREFARQFNLLAEDVGLLYETLGLDPDDSDPAAGAAVGGSGTHGHDADEVNILDTGGFYTGTTAEAALQEVGAHPPDTVDAHDASAISVVPFGSISATDVQGALEQIFALIGGNMSAASVHIPFGAGFTVPGNESSTRIEYNTTDFDTASMWAGTPDFEFTVDATGWWLGTVYCLVENTGSFIDGYGRVSILTDSANVGVFQNGGALSRPSPDTAGDGFELSHTGLQFLTAGDKVWVEVAQDTTETLTVHSFFAIGRIL